MATILVLDDEMDYREELANCLTRAGHTVLTAHDGLSSIDIGLRIRPEIVIADWMLRDVADGLDVGDVLRMVNPQTKVVLITGFASKDLRREADNHDIFRFIDKPFSGEELRNVVSAATRQQKSESGIDSEDGWSPVAILEVSADGEITYRNPAAKQLLSEIEPAAGARTITEILSSSDLLALQTSSNQWVYLSPLLHSEATWSVSVRPTGSGFSSFLIILDAPHFHLQHAPAVQLLLGRHNNVKPVWPFDVHFLIVIEQPIARRILAKSLQLLGCVCQSTASTTEALSLLRGDPDILVTILDWSVTNSNTLTFVENLRQIRPELVILGTGMDSDRLQFQDCGVNRFLEHPCHAKEVLQILNSHERTL